MSWIDIIGVVFGVIIGQILRNQHEQIEKLEKRIDDLTQEGQDDYHRLKGMIEANSVALHALATRVKGQANMIRGLDDDRNASVHFQQAVQKVLKIEMPQASSFAEPITSEAHPPEEMAIKCVCGQFQYTNRKAKDMEALEVLARENGWTDRKTPDGTYWFCRGCTNARREQPAE